MRLCIRGLCRRRVLRLWALWVLWVLVLGFAALSLTHTDLLHQSQDLTEGKSTALVPPLHFAGPLGLEVLDSWDERSQSGVESLQEDQLLSVPSAGGKHSNHEQKRSYMLLKPQGAGNEPRGSAPVMGAQHAPGSTRREGVPLQPGLPESRAPGCLGGQYSESLPSVSVVLCFRDEPRDSLLQTLHSVLDTAPPHLLLEVLLLDDHSHNEELKGALTQYVARLRRVRLIRSPWPLGPGRCRSLGASRATGDVLVFMDPRCEAHTGWMEPLLERLTQDRTLVVSPLLDVLDPQSRQYSASPWPVRGVWDWGLDFHWDTSAPPSAPPSGLEQEQQEDMDILPLKSPALGGEVLAVDRLFFDRIGAYDPGIVAWGPQQVELSLRVWSCGGALEVVPCSRVPLRKGPSPLYEPPEQEQLQRDRMRVAEVWMEHYRGVFYRRNTLAHSIRQVEAPNITARLQLQRALGCRDISWYLSSVAPELHVPQDQPGLSGELYNVGSSSCVDFPRGQAPERGWDVVMVPCSGTGTQHCELTSSGALRWGPRADLCLDSTDRLLLTLCARQTLPPGSQHWSYRKMTGQLLHSVSQLCLEAVAPTGQAGVLAQGPLGAVGVGSVVLRPCSHLPQQQWRFELLVDPVDF